MDPASEGVGTVPLRAEALFQHQRRSHFEETDRLLAWFLLAQWLVGLVATLVVSAQAVTGTAIASVHRPPTWDGVLMSGAIVTLPIAMALLQPGRVGTRHAIATAQILLGALLIHYSAGQSEAHFHVIGSLAFLAFYGDRHVLITAAILVFADHFLYGYYRPGEVYGVAEFDLWRSVEHAGWVAFELAVLFSWCHRRTLEMRQHARRRAELEHAWARGEKTIREKKADQARLVAILDATTDFVGIAEKDGRAVYVNPAGRRMVGIGDRDVRQTTIPDYLPAWASAIVAAEGLPTAVLEGSWSGEVALSHVDGREIPVSMLILAHKGAGG